MRILLGALLLWLAVPALAVIETYEFETEKQRERYQNFVEELRCPKCQNQNLEDSNAPIAADLRRELHRLLLEGHSDGEIVDFMVSRYGEFVLYRPPIDRNTLILWFAPGLFLVGGLLAVVLLVRRQRRSEAEPALAGADRERLDTLLDDDASSRRRDS